MRPSWEKAEHAELLAHLEPHSMSEAAKLGEREERFARKEYRGSLQNARLGDKLRQERRLTAYEEL